MNISRINLVPHIQITNVLFYEEISSKNEYYLTILEWRLL